MTCVRMKYPTIRTLLALPLLAACSTAAFEPATGDDDGNGSEAVTDDTGEAYVPPPFAPSEGTWTVQSSTLDQDGCGLEDAVDRGEPGSTAELVSQGNSIFEMTFATGGETVACAIDSEEVLSFACDATQDTDPTATDMGLDAEIPFTLLTDGAFSDEWNLEMTSTVEIDCSGADCGLVELLLGTSFPCEMVLSSVLESGA